MVISVILDQITKVIAIEHLMPINSHPFIPGLVEFSYTTNPGIAFGMLGGMGWLFIPISTIGIAALVFMMIKYRKRISPLLVISVSMIAGGGIGNQIDRILRGEVVDFLNFQFMDFPIFNVADCFVCVGCFLAVISLIFFDRELIFETKKPEDTDISGEKND